MLLKFGGWKFVLRCSEVDELEFHHGTPNYQTTCQNNPTSFETTPRPILGGEFMQLILIISEPTLCVEILLLRQTFSGKITMYTSYTVQKE